MRILLKSILLAQEPSLRPINLLVDLERGIVDIPSSGETEAEKVLDLTGKQVYASPGWIDLGAFCGEPGDERSQTLFSLSKEAKQGGYSTVLLHPHHSRQYSTEGEIEGLSKKKYDVDFLVAAPLSEDLKGNKLQELRHFGRARASAFSDGYRYQGNSAFYSQALQYGLGLDAPIFIRPDIPSISQAGQAYDGNVSAITGLPGVMGDLELMAVRQYLQAAQNFHARIHFSCLTDPRAVDEVLSNREQGLSATCDVSGTHLVHHEGEYEKFDSIFKVYPFLREKGRMEALQKLVKKHRLPVISNHKSASPEGKDTDFIHAEFGARTIETTPWAVISACNLTAFEAYGCFYLEPAKVLGMDRNGIVSGCPVNLILFSLDDAAEPQSILSPNNQKASPLLARFFRNEMTFTSPLLSR